jgi:hypothetical protein
VFFLVLKWRHGRQSVYFHSWQIQKGLSVGASWHAAYADSAYVYVGGLDYRMTEGDVITIFSQVVFCHVFMRRVQALASCTAFFNLGN